MEDKHTKHTEWVESLCIDTWKDVYRFIYYKVQNREEAEDITQETYARALAYFEKNDIKVTDYTNYLKTIAINILRDQWRSRSGKTAGISLEEAAPAEIALEDFTDRLDERTLLEEALAKLSKEQQTVITLRIIKGYSAKETAKLMKKRVGTVRVIQYRAVKALAELLSD